MATTQVTTFEACYSNRSLLSDTTRRHHVPFHPPYHVLKASPAPDLDREVVLVCSSVRPFVCSSVRLFVRSSVRLFVRSSVRLFPTIFLFESLVPLPRSGPETIQWLTRRRWSVLFLNSSDLLSTHPVRPLISFPFNSTQPNSSQLHELRSSSSYLRSSLLYIPLRSRILIE
jgi:hypothetical protein